MPNVTRTQDWLNLINELANALENESSPFRNSRRKWGLLQHYIENARELCARADHVADAEAIALNLLSKVSKLSS